DSVLCSRAAGPKITILLLLHLPTQAHDKGGGRSGVAFCAFGWATEDGAFFNNLQSIGVGAGRGPGAGCCAGMAGLVLGVPGLSAHTSLLRWVVAVHASVR